jgi:hypothetical protein
MYFDFGVPIPVSHITSGYPWPSDTVRRPCRSCARCPGRFGPPIVPCAPRRLARWAHRLAPNCITHPHWMYKRPWHLARPPAAAALAAIRECLWRTHKQTPRLQCVNGGPGVVERRFRSLQTQRNVPAPSLLKLQRERRETTELGYPG